MDQMMSAQWPRRVQLSRRRRMPPSTVSVAYPTKWANPHRPKTRSRAANTEACRLYLRDLTAGTLPFTVADVRRDLRGLSLACWCPPDLPCHADILLLVANTGRASDE